MKSEHQCFTGASGRRGWEPIVLRRDPCSMRRKMVSSPLFGPSSPLYAAEVSPNCSLFPINWKILTNNLLLGGFGGFLCLPECSSEFGLLKINAKKDQKKALI